MYRTFTCGELNINNVNKTVTLCGWVQRIRDKGGMIWIDLRDRYGITQLVFEKSTSPDALIKQVRDLGREFVIQVEGTVIERVAKNPNIPTGEIEIKVNTITILSRSEIPPFTIEENTDGGDELRMKYRYLDLRRNVVRKNLELRHRMASETRKYLDSEGFIETETPFLIKSTPEGARDFVVPSRMHAGEFYALPQSPQTFKQLLMVAGFDKYYQIVRCFRDEDLRADRQPEFTQIDCEMSFVDQNDILNTFEGLAKHLFKEVLNVEIKDRFPQIPWSEAIAKYGTDKPDIRFEMKITELTSLVKGKNFNVFDNAEYIGGICAKGCAGYSRKQLDNLTKFVQKPQIGAKGLIYIKCYTEDMKTEENRNYKSSIDKFFPDPDLAKIAQATGAKPGDLVFILAGGRTSALNALSELRLEIGGKLGLRDQDKYSPLWVVDFPLLEWNEETKRYYAMHHPFTSPKQEDMEKLDTAPGEVRANAYDLVINGVEIGGGSIRIHNNKLQQKMFKCLGFTEEEAQNQFGFLMDAFKYGAPPHGGIAFGFDRWCALFGGSESIRDFIAFPKNNAGRDVMIDSPSEISEEQLKELNLKLEEKTRDIVK